MSYNFFNVPGLDTDCAHSQTSYLVERMEELSGGDTSIYE